MNFPRNPVKESFSDQGGDFLRAIDSPLQEGVTPFSNQMKSSIGNNGMFDMTDTNIYKQKGGTTGYDPYFDIDDKSKQRREKLNAALNTEVGR